MIDEDVRLFPAFQQSPHLWIEKTFNLVPQPQIYGVRDDLPAEESKQQHFQRIPSAMQALYRWQDQYVRIKERPGTWFARARTGK